jgi:branched-chain amino acid transport system substrate-binding protein
MKRPTHWISSFAAIAAAAVLVTGCGSRDDGGSGTSTASAPASTAAASAPAADGLGTPKKATGKPIVVGMLNLETGPVTFPEARQAAEAGVKYVNDYLGGIGGRPLKIKACATDGQPATSSRCASQIADKDPLFILGAADTGASGAFPVWKRKGVAYIGGVPFTPAESNASNAAIFISLVVADNAAAAKYAYDELGVRTAVILATDDTQGRYTGSVIASAMKGVGIDVKTVPVNPSAADLSSSAAAALSSSPDLVYDETPNACPAALKALKAVGYSGKLAGIDPCTSPPAIKSAGGAAEGLYFAQPFVALDSDDPDAKLATAILQKYAPKDIALDSIALAGLASVINVQKTLSALPADKLTKDAILPAFKTGGDHANFLAHPYTCDGKQVPGQSAVCNSYQKIKQIKDGNVVTVTSGWVTGAKYYKPAPPS